MDIQQAILTIAGLLVFAQLAHPLSRLLRLPVVVTLAIMGVGLGVSMRLPQTGMAEVFSGFAISSDLMVYALLPVLLFQGALAIDIRHLLRDGVAVMLLAIFAVLVSVAVIGGVVHIVSGVDLVICLLLGAIVATTDPSAVIAVFRSLGAPPRLTRLVEGESLLNDATAIAMFSVLLAAVLADTDPTLMGVVGGLGQGFGLGLATGLVLGLALSIITGLFSPFPPLQITLTLVQPFVVFLIVDSVPGASGVIGVVVAGIVLGTIGRSRFSRENFAFMEKMLEQASDWATGLIVLLAAIVVPSHIQVITWMDLIFVGLTAFAALLARFIVLWAISPVLSFGGLMRPIEDPMKLALLWGGLRGAMTLALGLAALESGLPSDVSRFLLVTATGYALFTLLVQGTTLRVMMRWLGLDSLPEAEQAFRDQALREALVNTRSATLTFARRIGLSAAATEDERLAGHDERIDALLNKESYDALPDKEKLRLGLAAIVAHERNLVLTQKAVSGLPTLLVDKYLYALDSMRDAARYEGRSGYLSTARRPLAPTALLRVYIALHNWVGISRPLSRYMARRFHHLLVMRILVTQTRWYARTRLPGVFGERVAEVLGEIVDRRLEQIMEHIEVIRLQYPSFAISLEEAMVTRYALSEEKKQIDILEEEGMIDAQVARAMRLEGERLARQTNAEMRVDIEKPRPELLRRLRVFEQFSDAQIKRLSKAMRSVYVQPGEMVYEPGDQITHIYFIASGAVEVVRGDEKSRLGPGEAFGQLRILNADMQPAFVKAIGYSHFFRLPIKQFRAFLREEPEWRGRLEDESSLNESQKEDLREKRVSRSKKKKDKETKATSPQDKAQD